MPMRLLPATWHKGGRMTLGVPVKPNRECVQGQVSRILKFSYIIRDNDMNDS